VGVYRASRFYAIHADHLNTPRLMTDDSNKAVWQWPYSAFGDNKPTGILKATASPNNAVTQDVTTNAMLKATNPAVKFNLRYPGQYADDESNMFYNYQRSYQFGQGRYPQADPIGLSGGPNRFGYANQNSLSNIDPLGLESGPASPNIGDPLPPSPPSPGGNRGDNSASGTFCEPYSPIKKWVNWACSAGMVSSALCCGEAHRQCVIKAATEGGDESKCAAQLMTCNAYGGRGSK
jgi:RHS repeat-associated protein